MSLLSPPLGQVAEAARSGASAVDTLYGKWTLASAVFFVTFELSVVFLAGWPPADRPWLDGMNYVFGRDFLNTWLGARSMFFGGPAPWFNYHIYNEALRQFLGIPYPEVYWSYPPHLVLLVWPLGLLPYMPAYLVWCAVGIAAYLFVCLSIVPRRHLLFLAAAPGIAICLFFGQNGFYTAALLVGGLVCRERRPILAGVLFGILTIKPQLGLLLPIVLLLERRWHAIASAVLTAAALVIATSMLFGFSVWIEFWQKVIPQQVWLTETSDGLFYSMAATPFFGAKLLHLPLKMAWSVQYGVAALALAAVVWTFRKRRDPVLSLALLVTATFLFTPYILNYDMVAFGVVVALLRDRDDNTLYDHWLLIAIWSLPVTMMLSAIAWIPLAPVVLIGFGARLLWRLARNEQRRPVKHDPGLSSDVIRGWIPAFRKIMPKQTAKAG